MITLETRYHVSIVELVIENIKSKDVELVRWPRILIKILYFTGDQHFFQKSPGIKSHYDWVEKLFHLFTWEGYFGNEETVSGNLLTGEATGAYLTGALGQGVIRLAFTVKTVFFCLGKFWIKFNSQCQSLRDWYLLLSLRNKQWTNGVTVWSYHVTYALQRVSTWRTWRNAYLTR